MAGFLAYLALIGGMLTMFNFSDAISDRIRNGGKFNKRQLTKLLNDPAVIALIDKKLEERRSHSQQELEEAALKMLVEDNGFAGKVFDKALERKK